MNRWILWEAILFIAVVFLFLYRFVFLESIIVSFFPSLLFWVFTANFLSNSQFFRQTYWVIYYFMFSSMISLLDPSSLLLNLYWLLSISQQKWLNVESSFTISFTIFSGILSPSHFLYFLFNFGGLSFCFRETPLPMASCERDHCNKFFSFSFVL